MALIRWEPARELRTHAERNEPAVRHVLRLCDPAQRRPHRGASLDSGDGRGRDREQYVLRADLPGLSEGDVNVELEDNVLTDLR